MESLIIYLIIALFAIFSGIKNYKKEKAKNKERAKNIQPQPIPTIKPFQKKEGKEISSTPTISKEKSNGQKTNHEYSYNESKTQPSLNDQYNSRYKGSSKNIYNDKNIESILARVEEYSDANEKAAFFVETDDNINKGNQKTNSFDLELNTPEDYRRAFIYTLIFDKKY